MGKKDIIKIEGPISVDLDMLGVMDPDITVNIIAPNIFKRCKNIV